MDALLLVVPLGWFVFWVLRFVFEVGSGEVAQDVGIFDGDDTSSPNEFAEAVDGADARLSEKILF